MSRWIAILAIGCATAVTLQSVGCGGSDKDDEGSGETLKSVDCQTITNACHTYDTGTGTGHDCHELAHEDNAATCKAQLTKCLAACK